ncbi:MAG: ArgR family transcriptional regulator [Bdellovibrionaceae bacterium]|nr:ArgR family transcriptional regulator [Pseudobdellovibrionaceae bacterium]
MQLNHEVKNDSQERLSILRQLIREGASSTQEDLVKALKRKKFDVNQSTISRDLRRIGAIKATNTNGEIVYRLSEEVPSPSQPLGPSLAGLLIDIQANENLIVMQTTPGSASLMARHIDSHKDSLGVLGTIAGDDAVFIAPISTKQIPSVMKKIREEI